MLNDTQIKILKKSISDQNRVEKSDSELFQMFLGIFKESKIDNKEIQKELNSEVAKLTKSEVILRAKKQIVKLSKEYVELGVITKFDYLMYSNIKQIVMTLKGISKIYPEELKKVTKEIASVYTKGISDLRYNNLMVEKLQELKSEYSLKEVEGEFKVGSFFEMVQKTLPKLSDDEKKQLLQMIA